MRVRGTIQGAAIALLLLAAPVMGVASEHPGEELVGLLLSPEAARVVVHRELYQCEAGQAEPDLLLLTVGTETSRDRTHHFHPLASLAFDRTLGTDENGQWLALWTFGPSRAGWRRNLHSVFPLPVRAPRASSGELERLDEQLLALRENSDRSRWQVPDPIIQLHNLGRAPRSQGFWGGLRRVLDWADVANPAQFLFRTYLLRRKDRQERDFQRAYLALQWLLDLEFNEGKNAAWLSTLNDMQFHLLRNRSFFGRWIKHADALELVYGYDSHLRHNLGKASSWMQSAANEHYLRYQPIYRFTENGAEFPLGGVLYYDPRLGPPPDPNWWEVANPFDLPYNPHQHPEVQQLARAHPEELIPLAVYTFQTELNLRPIIAIDFFAPANPRTRENTSQLMLLAKQWLAITTGALAAERIPYRAIAWAANKKGYTFLVDKSSRLGIEELRVALQAELYFEPTLRRLLMERADQRVLNPLVKPGPVQERLAHLQYESLRAAEAHALCQRTKEIRREMRERLDVPDDLSPAEQRQEVAQRLVAWHHQVRLEDFVSQPLEDFGSLGSLQKPLHYFLDRAPAKPKELEELLARLYAKLYRQQLRLPAGHSVPELNATVALTRQVWQHQTAPRDPEGFERRRVEVEEKSRSAIEREHRQLEQTRIKMLDEFLQASHRQLKGFRQAGCERPLVSPAEFEAHLTLLFEVVQAAEADEQLRGEIDRHRPRLHRDLDEVLAIFDTCGSQPGELWRADALDTCRDLVASLQQQIVQPRQTRPAGGG